MRAGNRVPTFDPIDTRADDAARLVRMQWGMPACPVRNLVGWIESAGCMVIEEDFGTTRVDGMSQWVNDIPVIFLNSAAPTDRKRLTLAHELGHLSLHSNEAVEELEEQANAFAAEFLMPIEVIRPQLRNLRVDRLFDLKREWAVSMGALVEHAYRAGLLTPAQRTSMWKALSARGWRTREPLSSNLFQKSQSSPTKSPAPSWIAAYRRRRWLRSLVFHLRLRTDSLCFPKKHWASQSRLTAVGGDHSNKSAVESGLH